jgi:hypothetical protein
LKDDNPGGTIYTFDGKGASSPAAPHHWTIRDASVDANETHASTSSPIDRRLQTLTKTTVSLLLPAQYPKSVAPGYLGFVTFCFSASVAGSAAMVLSTQTLLLAIGVVGHQAQDATVGIMAGAFNWVMKDFVGQLGGVLFASQMGQTRAFDSDPKRWRMLAAMALDAATLMEILSPLCPSSLILPVASVANIGKNIGFLTASASRAALHQSVAITGNLGDVTAKAGSQAIMASLIGTSVGIGLSSLLQHDTLNFAMGFFFLSVIHQGCNYLSLKYVPLAHFNMQRLGLVLDDLVERQLHNNSTVLSVLSPSHVSKKETFFPLSPPDILKTKEWLRIGRPLEQICPDPNQLQRLINLVPKECQHFLSINDDGKIDVVYFTKATGEDVICGIYHAWLARMILQDGGVSKNNIDTIQSTFRQVQETYPTLLKQLTEQGWNTSMDVTSIESSSSYRIDIDR